MGTFDGDVLIAEATVSAYDLFDWDLSAGVIGCKVDWLMGRVY